MDVVHVDMILRRVQRPPAVYGVVRQDAVGSTLERDDDDEWQQRRKQQSESMMAAIERARQRREDDERRIKDEQSTGRLVVKQHQDDKVWKLGYSENYTQTSSSDRTVYYKGCYWLKLFNGLIWKLND